MNLVSTDTQGTRPWHSARRVDDICDRFEDAWKADQPPRIEDFLGDCEDELRPVLLGELLKLESHYRRERYPEMCEPHLRRAEPKERYSLVAFHAKGGMGRVSIYFDSAMRRRVALKELHPGRAADAAVLNRFLQEARITGRLEHPSIIPVYELVPPASDRAPFYTMRFVSGRTLTKAIGQYHTKRRAGESVSLEFLTLLNAFVSVCQTVAYAHTQGVVHRDLKGNNVIIGEFGEVIVLDWGLAKLIGERDIAEESVGTTDSEVLHETMEGVVKGTQGFLAPEQAAARSDLIGPRTDVYGLGAMLYEILTGQVPFAGSSLRLFLESVATVEPVRPSNLVPETPIELETACRRAMAKDPQERHACANELADEIRRWMAESADRSRALQERERFFNLSLDMLCTVGADEHFRQLNPAWEKTLGWTNAELMSKPFSEFLHPEDRAETLAQTRMVQAGAGRVTGEPHENRYLHKDGTFRWISWTASLIPGEQLIYAVGRDVTERKLAEIELHRSKERFELAVRGSGDGLWDWDRETGESYYSPQWKSMIGYEDHEISHAISEWETRLHPDDRDRALTALRSCTEGDESEYEVEYRFRHKDGSYRWILDRGVAVRNENGVARMAGSHTDITERKRLEEELLESERLHLQAIARITAELDRVRNQKNL